MADRVLLAPDAFKGTLSAAAVASALATGMRERGVLAQQCPVADGGEGTMEVLLGALGGQAFAARCSDPLGRPLTARWARLGDGRSAVVEAAQASGLALLSPDERDAERASSRGTGELILAAVAAGAERVIVAVGGTASTDGGAGALAAIEAGGGLGESRILLACDVLTPFEAAAQTFAPQKGAAPEAVERLRRRLELIAQGLERDPRGVPMTGAGGGLAGALWSRCGADLCSGAELVLEALGFQARLSEADAVVIGEGRLDAQSLQGKAPGAILRRAREHGIPVHAVVAEAEVDRADPAWRGLGAIRLARSIEELTRTGEEWPWVQERR
jgi:glycerate kinase